MNILVIGGGAMGRSLYDGWIKAGWPEKQIAIVDQNPNLNVGDLSYIQAKNRQPMMVVIAVKPQHVAAAISEHDDRIKPTNIIVSIAAGVTLAALNKMASNKVPVVRVMPNIAVKSLKGTIALCTDGSVETDTINAVKSAFAKVGECITINEDQMDVFTALAGSGPAYFFQLVEHLAAAGSAAGLSEEASNRIAVQVFVGAAALLAETGKPPASLRQAVTSPAGTTEAGLGALNANGKLIELFRDCIQAATSRSKELATGMN